jgi:hypothetical protein
MENRDLHARKLGSPKKESSFAKKIRSQAAVFGVALMSLLGHGCQSKDVDSSAVREGNDSIGEHGYGDQKYRLLNESEKSKTNIDGKKEPTSISMKAVSAMISANELNKKSSKHNQNLNRDFLRENLRFLSTHQKAFYKNFLNLIASEKDIDVHKEFLSYLVAQIVDGLSKYSVGVQIVQYADTKKFAIEVTKLSDGGAELRRVCLDLDDLLGNSDLMNLAGKLDLQFYGFSLATAKEQDHKIDFLADYSDKSGVRRSVNIEQVLYLKTGKTLVRLDLKSQPEVSEAETSGSIIDKDPYLKKYYEGLSEDLQEDFAAFVDRIVKEEDEDAKRAVLNYLSEACELLTKWSSIPKNLSSKEISSALNEIRKVLKKDSTFPEQHRIPYFVTKVLDRKSNDLEDLNHP